MKEAAKATAAPVTNENTNPKAEVKPKAKDSEADISPNVRQDFPSQTFSNPLICHTFVPQEYYKLRLQTLQQLKDGNINPYPHKFLVTISLEEFINKYESLNDGDILEDTTWNIAGKRKAKVALENCS